MPKDGEPGHGGLMLQLVSSYLGSSHLLSARAVTRCPELHFSPEVLPSWLRPWPDLHSASAVPVPSFTVSCYRLFPCLKAPPAAFTLSHF